MEVQKKKLAPTALLKIWLTADMPRFVKCSPAFDTILTYPPDHAHSKYYKLVQRLYPKLFNSILWPAAASEFTRIFNNFLFLPCCSRICFMQDAMHQYDIHGSGYGLHPLYWYEQCSYTQPWAGKRFIIHGGDVATLSSGEVAWIFYIFTHCLQFDHCWRMFLWVQVLQLALYKDRALHLLIYHEPGKDRIVSLYCLAPQKCGYMVSISRRIKLYMASLKTDAKVLF